VVGLQTNAQDAALAMVFRQRVIVATLPAARHQILVAPQFRGSRAISA